ncbi:hypothetical protein [uncultured Methylibium sp.]|uniref:hypothetical protein n=1 Tax=uncultured Methylibium sp. TaxID=381093 RepID=UPI0025ED01E4|nr:hypothetical protein [uncultured Methylibium sp.]
MMLRPLALSSVLALLALSAQAQPRPAYSLDQPGVAQARAEYACARANCVPSKAPGKS